MHLTRRSLLASIAAAAALPLRAFAQEPQPLKLTVGFPAGDVSDILARLVAERMRVALGRPVLVDNRSGAGGIIAAEAVKAAPPDGSTLMLAPLATMVAFPYTYEKLRYDPLKDYEPVALLTSFDLAIAVLASGPKTLAELTQKVRADQAARTFASPAAGSLPHFFGLLYGDAIKVPMTHVPYRGDAPAKQALLGGEVTAMVAPVGAFIELEKAGKVRVLATSGAQRNALMPMVPTFKEQGVDAEASPWLALFAPLRTPKDEIARQSKAALEAVNQPDVKRRLAEMGLLASQQGPRELAETMLRDHQRWSVVIKDSGFKVAN